MGVRGGSELSESDPCSQLSLPPGFRFYPTDEELMVQYLCRKVAGHHFPLQIIADIDLYKYHPWDLPNKALFGEKEWYFFSPRDRKYANGSRPNRVAGSGYWKATGTDKIITSQGRKVGIKKALVFYIGKAPKGAKTNWIMHEYRLSEPPAAPSKKGGTRLDDWVLCRIYKKNSSSGQKLAADASAGTSQSQSQSQSKEFSHASSSSSSSQYDDAPEPLPEMNVQHRHYEHYEQKLNNSLPRLGSGDFDWATLAGLNPIIPEVHHSHMYAPAPAPMDEQVQSRNGIEGNRGLSNSPGLLTQTMNGFRSVDPFGVRCPDQAGGFGFRHTGSEPTD